jgi:3-oxoacyl-[acyl-carrier protein] reductase
VVSTSKAAIVTGGGQGIGRAAVLELAHRGHNVSVCDLVGDRAERVAEEVRSGGQQSQAFGADVSNKADVERVINKTLEQFGRIDVLVNNAGTHTPVKVVDMTDETFDRITNTILKGTFYFSRAVLPTMISQQSGTIINLSSVWAWACGPEAAPYCSAKAAVTAFTKSLAFEVGEYGIRVNAVAPGLVDTELYRSTSSREDRDFLIANCPMGRECTPEEIAKPIGFLASQEASWVNGETLTVSGGLYVR